MMLVGIALTTVFVAEDAVSKDKLEAIVKEEANNLDFNNLKLMRLLMVLIMI